jgi:hypothetical protein
MKSRIFSALFFCAFVFAGPAHAQATRHTTAAVTAAASADSSRTYDSQALRFESRWGSADIQRGVNGTVIGTVGWFRDFDVEALVASSPRAVAEARNFKTQNFRGSLVGGVGALTFLSGIVIASNSSNNAASPILIIAGAGGIAWGAHHLQVGYSALSRAFWWYNRDLSH